jgi:hypothetical protein
MQFGTDGESRTADCGRFRSCQSLTPQQLSTTRKNFANIVSGVFTPVLAKHTKSFNLIDTLSVGVDRIQRNFEPLQHQVELWRKTQITDDTARLIFYSAFVDGKLEEFRVLRLEIQPVDFREERRVEHLVPNQIPDRIETC